MSTVRAARVRTTSPACPPSTADHSRGATVFAPTPSVAIERARRIYGIGDDDSEGCAT